MVEVALAAEREAAIEVGRGVVRGQSDRLVVVGDGAVEVRLLVESIAARHECAGVGAVEFDRRVEIGDGGVQVVLRQAHAAAVGESARVARIEGDRRREILERAGEVALGAHGHAPILMQDGEIGRLIAARIDQRRAGRNALLIGGAPLSGAAAFVGCVLRMRGHGKQDRCGQGHDDTKSPKDDRRSLQHQSFTRHGGQSLNSLCLVSVVTNRR